WNDAKITTGGMVARIAPVYLSSLAEVSRQTEPLVATLMMPADELFSRTRGTKKSLKLFIVWLIRDALVTVMSIGESISQNVRSRPAPSTSAASSTSVGTFLRKLLYRSTPKEAAPPRCTRITLVSVL